ncbi:MAG TPA: hypothetical protein EYH57_06885 [Sulfurovum sp.]|nr:hypothetical protein [Sulfurovum sp.]
MKRFKLTLGILCACMLSTSTQAEEKSMEELSQELANPLAQIWNLSFQYNHTKLKGNLVQGNRFIDTTLFQPVLPIPLEGGYTAFARPVITYVKGPNGIGQSPNNISPNNPTGVGLTESAQFGDTILPIGVGKVNKLGWSWGAGATFIFPTSNNDLLGSHQYQAGPTGLLLWANKDWTIGTHIQHWWGFAKDGKSSSDPIMQKVIENAQNANLNHTDMQYFIVRNLPNAWQLRASPHITYDWSAKKDNRLTLPVALGIGKMIKIGPMPVMLLAEYQKTLISPDNIGSDATLMFQVNFIIKNPFGTL